MTENSGGSASRLLDAIRKAAPSGTWSQGVKLAREGAVAVESSDADEVVLRVRARGRPVAPTVVLYPGEIEWDCDCAGRVRPCEHIVAAAVSLGQAGGTVETLQPAVVRWARIAYRFSRAPEEGGLRVARAIVRGETSDPSQPVSETPLAGSLAALRANPDNAAELHLEEADLRADLLLESGSRAVLPPSKLEALLTVLRGARLVTLDGERVAISDEIVRPHAIVTDAAVDAVAGRPSGAPRDFSPRGDSRGSVAVTIAADARVREVVSPGVALVHEPGVGEMLCRLAETDLTGAYLQHLPQTRVYPPQALGELATNILPDLASRMLLDLRTRKVPPVVRDVPPRILLQVESDGRGTSPASSRPLSRPMNAAAAAAIDVLPLLVYGHPPSLRIDDGRAVHLGGPVPLRDPAAERRLIHKLREELDLIPGRRVRYEGADASRFAARLQRWRGDLAGDAARLLGSAARLSPQLRVDDRTTSAETATAGATAPANLHFDLVFRVEGAPTGGAATVSAESALRAYQDGLGLIPLDGGGWATLPRDFFAQHGERLAALLAAREADGRLARHALPSLAALCDALEHPAPPALERLATLAADFDVVPDAPLPPDLTATLRPYQREAANWLATLANAGLGAILADDMGLGKTLEALCAVTGPCLVVCPTSLLANWRAEIARFRPGLTVCTYHGPERTLDERADVVLTSYALMRLDSERLCARRWRTVILDEAQAIKNPDSQVARAAYALDADFRIALSGTPLENRLDELWSLVHFTNRGLLGGRREFDDRYGRAIANGDAQAAAALRKKLRPFLMRRLKRDVAPELPPRTDAVLRVTLDERERGIYDAVRAATRADVIAMLESGGGVMAALEALLRLRQAACHAALVPGQKANSSAKIEALLEAIGSASADGHKSLVFSQWTSLLDLVEPHLRDAELPFLRLDGSTRDRGAVVDRFQAPDGPPVMLLSLKAGGTGLNLTAADQVFLLDPWWNPATEDQAADRAHRIGQDRPVFVYRIVAEATVEERILALQERKRALAEAALREGGAGGATLTRDDLLALLA